jgi:hypothetical protein
MTLIDVFRIRSEYLVDLPLDLREKAISLIVAQELDASKNTSADFLVD